ncbi:serine hydrolase domain-containing protein [Saccharicrinis sp. 156]|uniref:serine hydrolase domain-containing protein n=1 Tax=Saccharicrinis sp. 156 TaxID=3417574 RepID=UPI003D33D9DB
MNYLYKLLIICFYILIFTTDLQSQESLENEFNITRISGEIDNLFKDYNLDNPGIAIGIVNQNELVIQKEYGLANLEHQIPITNKTTFHVASVSKQFTAFAILLLEAEEKLSLDDNVRKYIPEMNEFNNNITIRNLLNHTSGIKDQWNLLRLAGWRLDDMISNNQVLDLIYKQQSLNFTPNEEFMYCNSGYTLLAEIVARVSEKSFAEYMKENIFIPLGMYNTQFIDKEGFVINNKANSYYKRDEQFVEDIFNNTSVGATNLSTTIEDLSKWTINFTKKTIGNESIFQKMNTLGKLNSGNSFGYALGQFVNTYKGLARIEHSGMDASYQAYLGRFPEQNISIIIAINRSDINGGKIVRQLTDICLQEYFLQEKGISDVKKILSHKKPIQKNTKELVSLEGYFWNDKDNYSRQIAILDDTLYYMRPNNDNTALIPVGENEFEMQTAEYTSVSFSSNQMTVTLDDGYVILFNKYIPANYNMNSLEEFTGYYFSPELDAYYTFYIKENILHANHQRLGNFRLKAVMADYFIGNKGSFREINFQRDNSGKVEGFNVSSSRAKNIFFEKVR